MARIIKFRAWDKENTRMYHDVGVIPPHYKPARVAEDGKWSLQTNRNSTPLIPYNTQRYEIMQYTGLKDKNGVQIYEGDICHIEGRPSKLSTMVFYNGCFYLQGEEGTVDNFMGEAEGDATAFKVIGNIYENPDRLNEK